MQLGTPGLQIRVAKNYEAMSRQAADLILRELRQGPDLLLCLSAGGTPSRTYELLAAQQALEPKLFQKLRLIQIDEWAGLAANSPATCSVDLRKKVLQPLHITASRFAAFRSDAASLERECARMAGWLATHGPIDICILGLGENGHVAMNEPGRELNPNIHVAKLAPSSRRHALLQTLRRKPTHGLTLGMRDILGSRKVLLLVSGNRKRRPLRQLLTGRVSTRFPASFLCLHSNAMLLCDRDAAAKK